MNCKFSHKLLETPEEINRFIDDNEQFLADLYKREGKTNLGDFYLRRVREKEEALNKKQLSSLMIPPSLLNNSNSFDQFSRQTNGMWNNNTFGQSSALPNLGA